MACNQDALKRKKNDSDAFEKDIDLEEDFLKVRHDLNTCLTMAEIEKQIIELEKLSLAEQIGLFRSARAVCGLHGAGFTNLLWCNPSCIAIEFLAHNFQNGCYEALAECVQVNHRYFIFQGDRRFRIYVDISMLNSSLLF